MRYRNNGQGEDNILQNQFTTYLVTAIRWQKIAYLKKCAKLGTHELSTDFDSAFAQMLETQGTSAVSVEQPDAGPGARSDQRPGAVYLLCACSGEAQL